MQRTFSPKSPTLLGFAFAACLAASCDEKGVTSACPPLPLYATYPLGDAGPADASAAGAAQQEFAAAVDAGCATAPTQFPFDAAGAGGEAGETSVAKGGSSGSTAAGGSSGAAHAGVAGSSGSSGNASAGAAGSL